MIFYFLWSDGLLRHLDREKFLFFLGATESPLYLSRRWPLVTAIHWPRALFSPNYARAVVRWLGYRAELYDGLTG